MMQAQKKNIYIIHGHQATPNDHWFPWLSRHLNAAGHISKRIVLAQSAQPNFDDWQKILSLQMPKLDENTIIVAHSLGCLAALQYVNDYFQHRSGRVKAAVLAAGFMSPLPSLPALDGFIQQAQLDRRRLQQHLPLAVCLLSSNDARVPPPQTLQLSSFLQAQSIEIKNAGHFTAKDGYREFQTVLDILKPLLV